MVKHCKFILDGLLVFDILWCAHCSGVQIFDIFIEAYLPPASEVWEGYVITHVCHSVHGGGGMCVCVVVSQHALQVSRPTPNGEVEGNFIITSKTLIDLHQTCSTVVHDHKCSWCVDELRCFFFYFIILARIVSREGAEHHTLSN